MLYAPEELSAQEQLTVDRYMLITIIIIVACYRPCELLFTISVTLYNFLASLAGKILHWS